MFNEILRCPFFMKLETTWIALRPEVRSDIFTTKSRFARSRYCPQSLIWNINSLLQILKQKYSFVTAFLLGFVKSRVQIQSRKVSDVVGWSRNPKNTRSLSPIFYPSLTPQVGLHHFLHRTHKIGIIPYACWRGTNYLTFFETDKCCCV